jgi:glutaredoxin-related protein
MSFKNDPELLRLNRNERLLEKYEKNKKIGIALLSLDSALDIAIVKDVYNANQIIGKIR